MFDSGGPKAFKLEATGGREGAGGTPPGSGPTAASVRWAEGLSVRRSRRAQSPRLPRRTKEQPAAWRRGGRAACSMPTRRSAELVEGQGQQEGRAAGHPQRSTGRDGPCCTPVQPPRRAATAAAGEQVAAPLVGGEGWLLPKCPRRCPEHPQTHPTDSPLSLGGYTRPAGRLIDQSISSGPSARSSACAAAGTHAPPRPPTPTRAPRGHDCCTPPPSATAVLGPS